MEDNLRLISSKGLDTTTQMLPHLFFQYGQHSHCFYADVEVHSLVKTAMIQKMFNQAFKFF